MWGLRRVGLFISTHFIFNCILNFAINLMTKLQAPVVCGAFLWGAYKALILIISLHGVITLVGFWPGCMESTTIYCPPVWDLLLALAQTLRFKGPWFLVSSDSPSLYSQLNSVCSLAGIEPTHWHRIVSQACYNHSASSAAGFSQRWEI
jgi:hypothetical protein